MTTILNVSLKRREFLGAAAAGVLVLAVPLPVRAGAAEGAARLNAFVALTGDGTVILQSPFIEMGQGTYTGLAMIVAEEMDVDLTRMQVEQAPHGPDYKIMFNNSVRFTGGSLSVRSSYELLRRMGASARHLLMQAAAAQWQVPMAELKTEPGVVIHQDGKQRASYAELASAAAKLDAPADIALKDPKKFRLLGRSQSRLDIPDKCNGKAQFGIDFRMDNMLTAAVRQSPVFSGAVADIDDAKARTMPGVVAVEQIPNGIAVLADSYWHARQALETVKVKYKDLPAPDFSSEGYLARLNARLDEPGYPAENEGDVVGAFHGAARTITANYHVPFLAHATMEPMNAAAMVKDGRCTVWTPNQGADMVAEVAAQITGLPLTAIDVHTPYLGGGFGRRFNLDFVAQAVTLATRQPGRPVQVIWSREEDFQHDFYRPMTAARYRAAFDDQGALIATHYTTVGDGPSRQHASQWMANPKLDESVIEGAWQQPYAVANRRVDYVYEPSLAPVGFWRSVGNSVNAYFKESFLDEVAHAASQDPVEFRRGLLGEKPRFMKVLDTVAKTAAWRGAAWKAQDGSMHAMGVALHESFGSIVGQVAEVSVDAAGTPRVHQVWCAVDCGFALNPQNVVMQVESAIAYGLSAALHEQVPIKEGRALTNNFSDYLVLTAQEMPAVHVDIIDSGAELGGVGEIGTPPIAPAACNALFTLTGTRIRSLPIPANLNPDPKTAQRSAA